MRSAPSASWRTCPTAGAAAGRHRHDDVGTDHRDHQYRCRRPARARRRAALREQALQAEIHDRSRHADRRDHRGARAGICRLVRQRRQAARPSDQGRRRDRRAGLADAARAGIRQDDRFQIRRHEEYRRALRRLDHGRAVAAALRRQDAVGASRHRRHRHGVAADRHQPELGLRLGRSAAGRAWSRSTTRSNATPRSDPDSSAGQSRTQTR